MAGTEAAATPGYDALVEVSAVCIALATWKGSSTGTVPPIMPAGGSQAGAEALAELSVLAHRRRTDPALKGHLDRAAG